ncbi:MAG: hypothetical protein HDR43_01750 [Mycoplasma sp.]|nr:hypothetical protein [Mycoplasma sp.]
MTTNNKNKKWNFKINKGLYLIDIDKFNDKTKDDLWEKKQRNAFFAWIFAFLSVMIVVLILNILQTISLAIERDRLISYFSDTSTNPQQTWSINLMSSIIQILFSIIVVTALSMSIAKCIKQKTFKLISLLSTIFVFIQMIYGFMDLFQYIIFRQDLLASFSVSWIYILNFSMSFIYPFIWFFISRNVSLIRIISIRIEARDALLKTMNESGENGFNNPFGPNFFGQNQTKNPDLNSSVTKENDEFYLRLKNLSRDQLEEIAKTLSISGYDSMSDQEIINIIYDIRNVQDRESREIEVKPVDEIEKDDSKKEN